MPTIVPLLQKYSAKYRLDPRAVQAVAMGEGGLQNRQGDVGDLSGGGSYGPFQLYTQGALPKQYRGRPQAADAWAWSPEGVDYALRQMAQSGAAGLKGDAALEAIIRRFERPANPDRSVNLAKQRLASIPEVAELSAQAMRNIAMDASGPVDGRAVAAYATQTAQLFKNQELQEKYGALQVLNKTIESAVNPSDMTLSLLQRLGGTSARIAQSRRDSPIRLPDPVFYDEDDQAPPGKPVGELGPGVVLQVDNEDELPASSVGLVVEAKKWLGTKYSFGAGGNQGPTVGRTGKGFDCSGFIKYLMFQEFGIDLPHLASAQAKIGKYIDKPENLRPGDAIFFGTKGKEGHEGLYIGNGQFIHAPKTGDVVKISSLKSDYYKQRFVGGRRYGAAVRRKQEQKDGRQA